MPLPASDATFHASNARMSDPFEDGDISSHRSARAQWQEDSDEEEEDEIHVHPGAGNFEDGDISLARGNLQHSDTKYYHNDQDIGQDLSAPSTPQFEHTHDLGEGVVSVPPDDDGDLGATSSHEAERSHGNDASATKESAAASPKDSQTPIAAIYPAGIEQSAAQERSLPEPHTPRASVDRGDGRTSAEQSPSQPNKPAPSSPSVPHRTPAKTEAVSEWSHQQLAPHADVKDDSSDEEGDWQDMPVYARYDIYNDDGKLVAKENEEESGAPAGYANLGGAAKGYTKVTIDEDAQSANSMDDDTAYLFNKDRGAAADEYDEDLRDPLAQMQATKDLLTDNQRIAYVGVVRLAMADVVKDVESIERTKGARKEVDLARDTIKLWAQKMMVRLYAHMELDSAEQLMIEQLAQHGLRPDDLTPTLMQNARIKNPIATETVGSAPETLGPSAVEENSNTPASQHSPTSENGDGDDSVPPPYEAVEGQDMPQVRTPAQLPTSENLDIDIRWTVLCDLFLVLISGSTYDARSRSLLERVGGFLSVPWLDICRFEKRVTDALEMQQEANKEDWDEAENMEKRRKEARKKRLIVMGLATVGGGLVIGLSAGLLAPVIGAGLAAGFTTIGVTGTSTFLAGAGGAAVIGGSAAVTGGTIGARAANRRTGAVKTFEYRPLHNNKRVNLIVTVAGWMTGKVDDVRLPYSTIDPIMGDLYSIYWEPEMLRSMGDTINILATEALTQGLQQILGSTILISLMAAIQLPVVLTKLAYLIDNPWSNSLARADLAGLILADSLIERSLGSRPITLVGFSLGSRLIFSCLRELAKRGAVGLIQNVYLFGSPVIAKKDEYLRTKTVVSGRFVNGYATNDWILGYLFRATSGGLARVSGLAAVNVPGIENFDVTKTVPGHMSYRAAMPKLLREVGWAITSDEFEEIEDPDPDNHEKRQRGLINDIEEARKELQEKQSSKRFFGLFRGKKGLKKKEWETYEEASKGDPNREDPADGASAAGSVMFDVDSITREVASLAAQGIEIKELKTTMPPMRISSPPQLNPQPNSSRPVTPTNPTTVEPSSSRLKSETRPSSSSSSISKPFASRPTASSTDYDNIYDHDQDHHSSPNPAFSEETITMTFDSPPNPRNHARQFPYDNHPTSTSNSNPSPNLNPTPKPKPKPNSRFPVNPTSFAPRHNPNTTRDTSPQPPASFDLAMDQRHTAYMTDINSNNTLNGYDPIERSPSSPPTLGRAAPQSLGAAFGTTANGKAKGGARPPPPPQRADTPPSTWERGDLGDRYGGGGGGDLDDRYGGGGGDLGDRYGGGGDLGDHSGASNVRTGTNVWADDDDEDEFGREREMEMTFE